MRDLRGKIKNFNESEKNAYKTYKIKMRIVLADLTLIPDIPGMSFIQKTYIMLTHQTDIWLCAGIPFIFVKRRSFNLK
ncbi:hypothetical protein BXY57_2426 [Thermoflavifilum aggregans]|uniref:Uncharacterized protein n=1 Tax=Thermoflavifilum aggregans TaxID=454188 RepID=A0A2M9CY71_9BACT|nr:hypothetical protein BXY57_2426 [Thermoflavifilum aggregans]